MAKFFNSRAADEIAKQTRRLRDDPIAVDNVRTPVRLASGGSVQLFEVAGDLQYEDFAFEDDDLCATISPPYCDAYKLVYNTSTRGFERSGDLQQIFMSIADRGCDGNYRGTPLVADGNRVWCAKHSSTGWEIVSNYDTSFWVELETDLTYDEVEGVTGLLLVNSSGAWSTITPYIHHIFPPPTLTSGKIPAGTRIKVERVSGSDEFWVPIVYQTFDRCTAKIDDAGGMETTDSTIAVDNVAVIRGVSPLDDPTDTSEELTVYNVHAWEADDDADCRIEWNQTTEHWEIYNVTCPAA